DVEIEADGVEHRRRGDEEPALAAGEAVRAALAHARLAPEAAAIAAHEEPFGGGDVEPARCGAQVVDHVERSANRMPCSAAADANAAVEGARPQFAAELGQRLDVVAADLARRSDAPLAEEQAARGRHDGLRSNIQPIGFTFA